MSTPPSGRLRHLPLTSNPGTQVGCRPPVARCRTGRRGCDPVAELGEAAVAFWASAFLGAVIVPIVHFYGRKELGHILTISRPKVFITAEEFGRMKFEPDLCADVPIVGLVGAERGSREERLPRFDDLLADEPMTGTMAADPAGPALIAFTSGTTSNPKVSSTATRRSASRLDSFWRTIDPTVAGS